MLSTLKRFIRRSGAYAKLFFDDWRSGRQLTIRQNNLKKIKDSDIILFCCLRDEAFRLDFFYTYYREMGVNHFIFVDNNSSDGFLDWARSKPDVTAFHTASSYKNARFGMLWCNDLLRRYGCGHWCVVVDPDEFLVYPKVENRSLRALTQHLDDEGKESFHAVMVDAYSDQPLNETILLPGKDPFEVCPYFDRDGYIQTEAWYGGRWIRGGPRLRTQFFEKPSEAPALNKIPLIKWKWYFHYNMSTHDARPYYLNLPHLHNRVSATGALFHFKMISTLKNKAEEEMRRRQHFSGGREYEQYLMHENSTYFKDGISLRYNGSAQLAELGLISAGDWF